MVNTPTLSFIIPCLNEENTLPIVLGKISKVNQYALSDYNVRVIVSDIGSTDKSVEIAQDFGAEVLHCKTRGYGAALDLAIKSTDTDFIIFPDADDRYDFFEALKGYDLVIGNRLNHNLKKESMPLLHRYLGTPVLNCIINFLFAKTQNKIKDCNSGFRCFSRKAYQNWNITGTGMEFATEMLVKALNAGTKFSHVDVTLHPDKEVRIPHLKTWRDGMRNLLQILVEAPHLFYILGLSTFIFSLIVILFGWLFDPIEIGIFNIFGIHTMLISLFFGVIGLSILTIGLDISTKREKLPFLYDYLINLSEDKLFWFSVFTLTISMGFVIILFFLWTEKGFVNIDFSKNIVFYFDWNIWNSICQLNHFFSSY
jgi:glycosyltransferase involved in cell wall biosynthesis